MQLKAFYWQKSDPSLLLVSDGLDLFDELESRESMRQGDPFAALGSLAAPEQLSAERSIQCIQHAGSCSKKT